MTLKNAVASCLVMALGIILVAHFALFWIYGGVFIYEDNLVILSIETVLSVAIFAFGIERLVSSAGVEARRRAWETSRKTKEYSRGINSFYYSQPLQSADISTTAIDNAVPWVTAVLAESGSDDLDAGVTATVNCDQIQSGVSVAASNFCNHTVAI